MTPKARPAAPLHDPEFAACLAAMPFDLCAVQDIAVAVSGGADSLALLYLLARWSSAGQGPRIHALTVDHGLRPESKTEARQVAMWITDWGKNKRHHIAAGTLTHQILTWRGVKPKTKIIETARTKRYALLTAYCKKKNIPCLFLAHHLDDQAETVLMRLAAGSGVDGLAAMAPVSEDHQILLLRPLLNIPHDRLCATLRAVGQNWVEDPTNQNNNYARPRLRHAREVLSGEGLTPERLSVLARRAAALRDVGARVADEAWQHHVRATPESVQIEITAWQDMLPDTQIRVLARALGHIAPKHRAARLEQIEEMVAALGIESSKTLRRTLAGCMVSRGVKWVKITRETRKNGE